MREIQLNCEKPSLLIAFSCKFGKITLHVTDTNAESTKPTTTGRIPLSAPLTILDDLNFSNKSVTTIMTMNEGNTTANVATNEPKMAPSTPNPEW